MTLTDAGPLIALLNRNDPQHDVCAEASVWLAPPMVTTWPAFTEAMHLLGDEGGWRVQRQLWAMVRRRALELAAIDPSQFGRVEELMQKYADVPMDLADATLVVIAEQRRMTRIFTLDSDFSVYRLHGRRAFEVVP